MTKSRSVAAAFAVLALPALLVGSGCSPKPADAAPAPPAGSTSLYNEPAPKGSQAERAADVDKKADEANTKLAKVVGIAIRVGAAIWMANDERCPTVDDLIKIKFVNEKVQTTDPWGGAYVISCKEKEPVVTSPGPDGKLGTADDIVAGK